MHAREHGASEQQRARLSASLALTLPRWRRAHLPRNDARYGLVLKSAAKQAYACTLRPHP